MNSISAEIQPLIIQFFRQQNDLYGNELYFSIPAFKCDLWNSIQNRWLKYFEMQIQLCKKCSLSKNHRHYVFGTGNPNANLMLIGEAPGEEEDMQGKPFVGKAGQLLTKILKAIEFNREEVYITNILKCRPPNNRDPEQEEIQQCLPYLLHQIQLIQPKIILALGRISAQTLLKTQKTLNHLRDENTTFQDIPVCVTYHPAALLRNPEWKHLAWKDVQKLRHIYDRIVGDKGTWKQAKEI